MADQLGQAVLTLTVDDQQFNAGLNKAKQSAGQVLGSVATSGGSLSGLSASLGGLATAATAVATGVAVAGVAVAGIGIAATQTAGSIQKLNAAFTGLTGSAEAAQRLRQDLFTLSKTTPFKNEEILTAAQRFLAVGVNVDKLQGTINRVGAIAAQSGQPLERLALIYAQVYAKGRLQGEENLQLLEAGVDLTQELAAVTGKSGTALQDAMSKGQISVNDFNNAILLATGEMTALQLAGQAVDVQFNNIFDNLGQLFGGFASSIAPALSAAFGVVNQVFDQAFPSLSSIEQLFKPLTDEAKRFADVLAGNPELISAIATATREWATIIVDNVATGLRFVNDLLSSIDGKQLVSAFLAVEVAVRRVFLAALALGVTLAKNAELTFRAVTNPVQFGKDIIKAGGFTQFIEQEYKDAERKWNEWANSQPLNPPTVKPGAAEQIAGDLDNKPKPPDAQQLAQQQLQRAQAQLAIQTVQQRIAYAKELAAAEAGVVRETIRQRQETEAGVQAAKDQVALIGAQIDALRLQGKDSGPEMQKLVDQQVVASEEVRLKLIEGATALKDAGKQLAEDVKQATLELAGVRNDPNGLNKFLNQQQIQERGQATLQLLTPSFREAQGRFTRLTGATAPEFSGNTTAVVDSVRQFIENVDREFNATNNVQQTQQALTDATNGLTSINERLVAVTEQLAGKNWQVNVNVPGGTAKGDVIGLVNPTF